MYRAANWLMAVVFVFAVAVQYNDPDPVRWMAVYGAACAVAVMAARGRRLPLSIPIAVAVIAVVWSVATMEDVPDMATYSHMFDAWEMKSLPVEEAREASGLLIVVVWMVVVAVREWRRPTS